MQFLKEAHAIHLLNDEQEEIGFISFPFVEDNVVNIDHTVVDKEYQGQGLAKLLMEEAITVIKENNYKVVATCSYAINYFMKHPELKYLLQ